MKKLFALAYLAFAVAVTITATQVIVNQGLDLSWGGVLLIVVPVIGVNGDKLLRRSCANHRHVGILSLLALAGFTMTVTSLLGGLTIGPGAFAAAVAAVIVHAVYRFWYLAETANNI